MTADVSLEDLRPPAPGMQPCPMCKGLGQILSDEELGATARAERKAAGITQATIALRMGISRSYMTQLERGQRKWTGALLLGFRRALDQEDGEV